MLSVRLAQLALALVVLIGAPAVLAADDQIPAGPGASLVYANCQTCHSLQYITDSKGLLEAQWKAVLASMEDYGLELNDQDKNKILEYLVTYLGPNPPPEPQTAAQPAQAQIDGETVYQHNCATCHGANGLGQPGYFPPLAGNADLTAAQEFPVLVVLNGIRGPIRVNGQDYNGSMPALDHLSNEKIAAVVNYVRGAWGNGNKTAPSTPVTAEQVARLRSQSLSPSEVHARRKQLKQ